MHDHIEEMGKNIVRCSHPDKPHKHTRLWIYKEIENVLAKDLGSKATRCIQLDTRSGNQKIDIKGLLKMKELKYLSVRADRFRYWESNIVNPEFPDALRYLCSEYYPFRSLPVTFQADNLVALEMVGSEIVQLWEGGERKVLNKLRILDLSHSMLSTLDLRLTPNLETLVLKKCSNLVKLCMPIECLKLKYVNLEFSTLIGTLDFRLAPSLEELYLVECNDLEKLQMPDKCVNLKDLRLNSSKLRTLDIGLNPNLRILDMGDCHYLEELNMAYECQNLSKLNISRSKLRTLNLGLTPNLETLHLEECYNLVELRPSVRGLKKLVHVDLSSLKFRLFSFRTNYSGYRSVNESLKVSPLDELHLTVESVKSCPLHPDNRLPKFRCCCFYVEDQPSLSGNIEMLMSVGMCACTNPETFSETICRLRRIRKLKIEGRIRVVPKDLYKLECLEELILSTTDIKHLPDSICMLKHLRSLELDHCWLLDKLPEEIGRLGRLKWLNVHGTRIRHLPHSIVLLEGLRIAASFEFLESCGFTFEKLEFFPLFCYIVVEGPAKAN